MNPPAATPTDLWQRRWQAFSAATLRGFHAYASWLVSISWRRFIVLALLLLVGMAILHDLPPFTWTITERIESPRLESPPATPKPPKPPKAPKPVVNVDKPQAGPQGEATGVEINIGKDGVRITPKYDAPAQAASAAQAAKAAAEQATQAVAAMASSAEGLRTALPPGASAEAANEVRRQIDESLREARDDVKEALRDLAQARRDVEQASADLGRERPRRTTRVTRIGVGDMLMNFTLFWILASIIIKFTYKGRIQAETKAARATETAEAESLKRQVVEARMAAMQAQVEPHFLFNTLASIDHLIETDPARASTMQKNLIALLRASMPTLREASDGGVRELGRELAVIRPYLEILKVRMEERLDIELAVPEGLHSAEFPPMMIQTLVENAIKHGLEPKPEGGKLRVSAEILHGKLAVTVADTGLGFGRAATAGTGVGLTNIRERLQMLYGNKASLTVAENQPSGTRVTVSVPYKPIAGAGD